jgi:hypothetical protein
VILEVRSSWLVFQANPKFSQIHQNPPKSEQNKSKKKAWISFDSLVRFEPFQRVALTPWGKKVFLRPLGPPKPLALGAIPSNTPDPQSNFRTIHSLNRNHAIIDS